LIGARDHPPEWACIAKKNFWCPRERQKKSKLLTKKKEGSMEKRRRSEENRGNNNEHAGKKKVRLSEQKKDEDDEEEQEEKHEDEEEPEGKEEEKDDPWRRLLRPVRTEALPLQFAKAVFPRTVTSWSARLGGEREDVLGKVWETAYLQERKSVAPVVQVRCLFFHNHAWSSGCFGGSARRFARADAASKAQRSLSCRIPVAHM
jgi:hypothetical protein